MKVLFWDLEVAPLLAWMWSLSQDRVDPGHVVQEAFLLGWGAQWRGSSVVHSAVLTPEEALAQDDSRVVGEIADLVREADMVVAHNGQRYDLRVLSARVLALGLEPLGPVQMLDTYLLAKRDFRLASLSLGHLAKVLGAPAKQSLPFSEWAKAYRGDYVALRKIRQYVRQDVRTLAAVFEAMLPHYRSLPRLRDGNGCPYCGSMDLKKRGVRRTAAATWQRYQCGSCGRYSRDPVPIGELKPGLRPL